MMDLDAQLYEQMKEELIWMVYHAVPIKEYLLHPGPNNVVFFRMGLILEAHESRKKSRRKDGETVER